MKTISTAQTVFLISFNASSVKYLTDNQQSEIGTLVKEHGEHGVEKIMRLHTGSNKFEKLSKDTIKRLFGWDTHTIQELQKVNFIK